LAYLSAIAVLKEDTDYEGLVVGAGIDCEESIMEAIKEASRT